MAQFFFDLHECGRATLDEDGLAFDGLEAARAEALRAARAIMSAEIAEGRLCLSCRIEIRDAAGAVVATMPFREAVRITGL